MSAARLVHPLAEGRAEGGAQPVAYPPPDVRVELGMPGSADEGGGRSLAVWLDRDGQRRQGGVDPGFEDHEVRTTASDDRRRRLTGKERQPSFALIDDRVVHDPGWRGVTPPSADDLMQAIPAGGPKIVTHRRTDYPPASSMTALVR